MNLQELSKEYRQSGEVCYDRVKELKKKLSNCTESETVKLQLRREITILTSMARDCVATSNYLANYYRGKRGEEND